jgi:hypothetical protein
MSGWRSGLRACSLLKYRSFCVLPRESDEVALSPSHWDVVRWTKRMNTIIPAAPPTHAPFEIHNNQIDFPDGKAINCKDPPRE